MLIELGLKALQILDDGRIRTAFDQELKHILLDLEDRPGDDRARKLNLQIEFKPIVGEDGMLENVTTQIQIGSRMPSRKTKLYSMQPRRSQQGPMLAFNELSLDDVTQDTLFDPPAEDLDP